jgi:hypothetical protein
VGLSPGLARVLHSDEIPIDAEMVHGLVSRVMPAYADAPVRRLASSGSTNALFRLGEDLLVRMPRQHGGSVHLGMIGQRHEGVQSKPGARTMARITPDSREQGCRYSGRSFQMSTAQRH